MNTCRKLLSALLCLALLASVLPLGVQPARAAENTDTTASVWNGTDVDINWYNDTETSFTLTTAAELAGLAQLVNGGNNFSGNTITLGDNIDLNDQAWTPIGNDSKPFIGTFDGGGYTISGLSIDNSSRSCQGLFGAVNSGGTVQNLIVLGSITGTSDQVYIGGVAGQNNGTVKDCTNKVKITWNGNDDDDVYIGGVVGLNFGIVENCSNSEAVNTSGTSAFAGGIVGGNGVGSGTVSGCYNTGTVTGTTVGGIAGANVHTISGCYNTGTVTGTTAGGVVGENCSEYFSGDQVGHNFGTVNSCYNTGTITGTTVGGVVGVNSNAGGSGTVNGCYYREDTAKSAIGDGSSTVENDASKTFNQFNSGEVAWLLQNALGGNGPTATQVWGQQLSGETPDEYPVLTSDPDKKVYQVTFMNGGSTFATDYANSGDSVAFPKPAPTSENKEFTEWVDEYTEYTDPITISGNDLVVHAQFTEKQPEKEEGYSINFTAETATADDNYEISTDGTDFSKDTCNITPGRTLYVRYEGNTMAVAENKIDDRPEAPTLSIDTTSEGVILSSDYYYSFTSDVYGNNDWKKGAGALVTVEPGDTIYIYLAATDEAFKSDVQTLTAADRGTAPTTPTIDYGSETLSGTTAEMEYRVGANGEWKQCTDEDMSVTEWMGQTGYFRTAATNKNYASDPVSLTIPARPVAPSVQGVNESIAGSNDGKITGLTAEIAYELSHDNGQTWTDVTAGSTEITGLEPGTYQVRIKAGTDRFASEAASVTIASGATPTYTLTVSAPTFGNVNEGYTQPAAQALTITNSGNSDATISSVTVDSANFTIAGSGAAVPAGGSISSWTIQPAAGLSPGTYSATITVTYNNDATAIANVQFIVEAAPVDPEDPVDPDDPPYNGKYSYEIVSDVGENGTIDVDRYATEGDQVTITVSPDEAYLLDDLTVTSGGKDVALTDNGDGTYTFTMPSGDVAVTATFAEDPNWEEPEDPATDVSEIFTDVPANHWAQAAIQYVYDNGLMTGVSDTAFAPEATTTRAMIVSMLARMENVTSAADAGFTDVATDDWYATAVNWAAANGIVNGISDDTFAPNDPITREQLAAMLMNYAQYKGLDVSARADLSHYSDAENISNWANDVLSWAVAEGLLTGVTDDTIAPQVHATRAQVAAILQRFLSE